MKIVVFNKVLRDTKEYKSILDAMDRKFCGSYLASQIISGISEDGYFEDEFYRITSPDKE